VTPLSRVREGTRGGFGDHLVARPGPDLFATQACDVGLGDRLLGGWRVQ
jgi:hypothetical protein